jgi:hypothetical protein
LWTGKTLLTGKTFWAGKALWAGITGKALWAGGTGVALDAGQSLGSGVALDAGQSLGSGLALGAGFTGRALHVPGDQRLVAFALRGRADDADLPVAAAPDTDAGPDRRP